MTDAQAAIAVSVCLTSTPRSLTWLVYQTGLPSPQVSSALRLLCCSGQAVYVIGKGFIAWTEECQTALETDVVADLIERAYGPK